MKELKAKILEAMISALPITIIVYLMSLLPWFNFIATELITFSVGAVFLALGIGLLNLGADLAMTYHVGAGLSRQKKLWLLAVSFVLGLLITVAEPNLPRLLVAFDSGGVTTGPITVPFLTALCVGISDILGVFLHTADHTAKEAALAMGMIMLFILVCQILFLKLP